MADKELKELFASNLKRWLDKRGKTQSDLRKYLAVSAATVSEWCSGKKIPRTDKLSAICTWLGIDLDDLLTDKSKSEETPYYLNDETREIAQAIFDNPQYKALFDASRKLSPADLQFVMDMIDRMRPDE